MKRIIVLEEEFIKRDYSPILITEYVKLKLKLQAKEIFADLLKESICGGYYLNGTLEIANNKLCKVKEKYGLTR